MSTLTHPGATPPAPPRPPRSRAAHAVMLIIGCLLGLVGLALAGAASASAVAMFAQRDGQFLTTPTERYAVDSHALTTTGIDLLDDQLPTPATAVELMIQATPTDGDRPVFLGVARLEDVDRYLSGVAHSELTSVSFAPFRATYRQVPGERVPEPPDTQNFWMSSRSGTGTQRLETTLRSGSWVVVVMNADGTSKVSADLAVGARTELLAPLTFGLGLAALLCLAGGVALLVAAGSGLAAASAEASGSLPVPTHLEAPATYPARLTGELQPVSRWLWLVKWFLAIPHLLVLALLWTATVAVTIVAGVAILITGRYPRPLFTFTVGVLRWSWRVGFYAFSVMGTDRYPPFTLQHTDYPADFDVDYPEHLSRGLVLIKSWLLAIPHLLIVGLVTSPWYWVADQRFTGGEPGRVGISLLGLLTLVVGVALLFTGRYPRPLFDLLLGVNRWLYRVLAYVALLRDEYPPFRLDQGPQEPADHPGSGSAVGRPDDLTNPLSSGT